MGGGLRRRVARVHLTAQRCRAAKGPPAAAAAPAQPWHVPAQPHLCGWLTTIKDSLATNPFLPTIPEATQVLDEPVLQVGQGIRAAVQAGTLTDDWLELKYCQRLGFQVQSQVQRTNPDGAFGGCTVLNFKDPGKYACQLHPAGVVGCSAAAALIRGGHVSLPLDLGNGPVSLEVPVTFQRVLCEPYTMTVVFFNLPGCLARKGFFAEILKARGLPVASDPHDFTGTYVVAEAASEVWGAGGLPVSPFAVANKVVAYVRPPSADPELSELPASLSFSDKTVTIIKRSHYRAWRCPAEPPADPHGVEEMQDVDADAAPGGADEADEPGVSGEGRDSSADRQPTLQVQLAAFRAEVDASLAAHQQQMTALLQQHMAAQQQQQLFLQQLQAMLGAQPVGPTAAAAMAAGSTILEQIRTCTVELHSATRRAAATMAGQHQPPPPPPPRPPIAAAAPLQQPQPQQQVAAPAGPPEQQLNGGGPSAPPLQQMLAEVEMQHRILSSPVPRAGVGHSARAQAPEPQSSFRPPTQPPSPAAPQVLLSQLAQGQQHDQPQQQQQPPRQWQQQLQRPPPPQRQQQPPQPQLPSQQQQPQPQHVGPAGAGLGERWWHRRQEGGNQGNGGTVVGPPPAPPASASGPSAVPPGLCTQPSPRPQIRQQPAVQAHISTDPSTSGRAAAPAGNSSSAPGRGKGSGRQEGPPGLQRGSAVAPGPTADAPEFTFAPMQLSRLQEAVAAGTMGRKHAPHPERETHGLRVLRAGFADELEGLLGPEAVLVTQNGRQRMEIDWAPAHPILAHQAPLQVVRSLLGLSTAALPSPEEVDPRPAVHAFLKALVMQYDEYVEPPPRRGTRRHSRSGSQDTTTPKTHPRRKPRKQQGSGGGQQ